MKKATKQRKDGVRVGWRVMQAVRFAGDQAMVANIIAGLQRIMDKLRKTSEAYETKIYLKKSKVMRAGRKEENLMTIKTDAVKLQQVRQYKYEGSTIKGDFKSQSEIRRRALLGTEAFLESDEPLRGKTGTRAGKKRPIKT
jgi:hypothetical protein